MGYASDRVHSAEADAYNRLAVGLGACSGMDRSNHNCNRFGGGVYHMAKMEMRLNEITHMVNRICLWGWCDCFFVLDGQEIRLNGKE